MGWRQEQQQQAWANWINQNQWDVFGTLNFSSLQHIRTADKDDVCGTMWRSYFGAIDRALYGQQRRNQSRFERVVLVQYGINSDYPHVHFLAKSPLPNEQFCILLNAVWASMYSSSARPASNEITPTATTILRVSPAFNLDIVLPPVWFMVVFAPNSIITCGVPVVPPVLFLYTIS